jgi:hypothetical protein
MTEAAKGASADEVKRSQRRQKAYAASRRAWAQAVGRPYEADRDPRPPPGELDAEPDE